MAPEPVSAAYFINTPYHSVCQYVYPLTLGKGSEKIATAATNTRATMEVLKASLSTRSVLYQRKVGDYFLPALLSFKYTFIGTFILGFSSGAETCNAPKDMWLSTMTILSLCISNKLVFTLAPNGWKGNIGFQSTYICRKGVCGSIVGWGIMLQARRSPVQVPDEMDFSIYLIIPAATWLWGRLSL
jgi:hypothetical protein